MEQKSLQSENDIMSWVSCDNISIFCNWTQTETGKHSVMSWFSPNIQECIDTQIIPLRQMKRWT